MPDYRRIVLAVDLTEESSVVAQRARALARAFGAELHVVHVIEPLSPPAVVRYVDTRRCWIRGTYDWSLHSTRYH